MVVLQERAPVARIMAQVGAAPPAQLLVARDGTVFAGVGHAPEFLAGLPFLDGVRLVRAGAGFAPIAGMPAVAGLLDVARANTPELCRGFQVISLARLQSDDLIIVRSDAVHEITFGAHADFLRQLAQLDYVLDQMGRDAPAQPLGSVNLALGGGQVPVSRAWAVTALRPAMPAAGGAHLPAATAVPALFSLPPQFSATSHDL
jgi:cell division protein FtsQ